MNEKLVLPRFDLPREGAHPAVRALWVTGGLVLMAAFVLVLAMWRHQTQVAASVAQAAALAAAAAAPPVAPPGLPPTAAAPTAAAHPALAVGDAEAASADEGDGDQAAKPTHHHSKHHAAAKSSKLAKSASSDHGGKKAGGKKEDPIDKLLNQFK